MNRIAAFFLHSLSLAIVAAATLSNSPRAAATIRYQVSLAHPEQHLFHVTMQIPDIAGEVTIQMPAWNALYQIRDFSAHVQQVEAFADGAKVPIEKVDKLTWKIQGTGTVTIRYGTYWDEPGPFAAQLNADHAFINPAMILMYAPSRRSDEVQIVLSDLPGTWKAGGPGVLSIESVGGATVFVGKFADFDALTDAPIEAGNYEEFSLAGFKPEIWVIVHGDNWRRREVEEQLRKICQYELTLLESAPFVRYTFIYHVGKAAAGAGGGMEHANSTAIAIPSDQYVAGVSAHEFFHLWNVKRIRPASLEPIDYTKEQYTRALWFAEGVTSTYGSYTLVRSGIWSKSQFYADLGQQIGELESRPANLWQSAEQSSLDTWLEKYSLYERDVASISYYTKGQVLGVLLDILIRDRTGNVRSLDDVMRAMNREFAQAGKPYHDSHDVQLVTEEVAGSSFEEFFRNYVHRANALPYAATLALAGLEARIEQRQSASLGFAVERETGGQVIVQVVEPDSPAAGAGLRVGDIIEKWNDGAGPRNLTRWLRGRSPGDVLKLHVNRDAKELDVELRLGSKTETGYEVREDPHASERAKRIRDGLLHGVTQQKAQVAGSR